LRLQSRRRVYELAFSNPPYTPTAGGDLLNDTYTSTATPATVGTTGQRMFCSTQTGVINYTLNGAGCVSTSPAL